MLLAVISPFDAIVTDAIATSSFSLVHILDNTCTKGMNKALLRSVPLIKSSLKCENPKSLNYIYY